MMPLIHVSNPFRTAIVADPWNWDVVDVSEIHKEAFALCRSALEYVRSQGQSTSVLLYGEAGSGKTHLLARLQAYLAGLLPTEPAAPPAVFVSVRLQTSPQMLWRHLRNRFGGDLLRATADGRSQLERILLPRLGATNPGIGEPRTWLERLQAEARNSRHEPEEMEEALDRLDQQAQLNDRDLITVLGHLLLGRHRRDARAWLRGESLPEVALGALGVNTEQDGELEERSRQVVLSLSRLTGPEIPLVFCFDQVEALQSHPQDLAGLYKFGQMIGFLRDETPNSVLISCILSTFLTTLNQAIISSDRDRLAVFGERALAPLTPDEGKRLIEARLHARPELEPLRPAGQDRFWPLSEPDLDQAFRLKRDTPRALLSFCAEKFEAVWRPELFVAKPSTSDFLAQEIEERLERAAAGASTDQTDQIVSHALPLLLRLIDSQWEIKAATRFLDADLVFENPRGRISISLCNHRNMTSLAARLRRLREQAKEQVLEDTAREKFILLRDARLPVGVQARRTREHREQLLNQGFQWLSAPAEMIAALDAWRGLWSDAKAGDLSNGGESIPSATVQEWLAANLDARMRPLRELLDLLLPDQAHPPEPGGQDGSDDFDLCEDISELLHNHHLVSVADAACKLDRDETIIEACARRYPERFGLLNGPPAVLFQLALPTSNDQTEVPGLTGE
ncbi:MAG TPA: ATP-binding protein [Blastocatellia bacterium]|nr:ATP-binding protein [Blastocatellia bacterium]